MKKLLFTLLVATMSLCAYAQKGEKSDRRQHFLRNRNREPGYRN